MLLSEIIEQLQVGEFSQLSFGGGTGKLTTDADYKAVVLHVNLALSTLYKRFNIKKGKLVLGITPQYSTYKVLSANSVHREGVSLKYVLDPIDDRFKDDINKIEKLYWEHDSVILPLNEANNPYSINNRTLTTLDIPRKYLDGLKLKDKIDPLEPDVYLNNRLVLEYRAGYFPSYKLTDLAIPEVTKFDFPDMYLEAVLYFVASRVHNPIGLVGDSGFHQGNNYAAKFEAECQRIEQMGLQMDQTSISTRFQRNGWV